MVMPISKLTITICSGNKVKLFRLNQLMTSLLRNIQKLKKQNMLTFVLILTPPQVKRVRLSGEKTKILTTTHLEFIALTALLLMKTLVNNHSLLKMIGKEIMRWSWVLDMLSQSIWSKTSSNLNWMRTKFNSSENDLGLL